MKRKLFSKKVLSILLTISMLFGMVGVPNVFAEETIPEPVTATLSIDQNVVQRGDTFVATVAMTDTGANSVGLILDYDAEQLEVVGDPKLGEVAQKGLIHHNVDGANVTFGYATAGKETLKAGIIFTVEFKVKAAGSGNLGLGLTVDTLVNSDNKTIESTVVNKAKEISIDIPLTSLKVNPESIILKEGKTSQLAVVYEPQDTTVDKTVKWSSSDDGVATVDKDGLVTAKAAGTATITAAMGGKEATCAVTVKGAVATAVEWVSEPTKKDYIQDQALDLTDGKIKVTYDNDTAKELVVDKSMCSGYDMTKAGEQTITVKIDDISVSYKINVAEKVLQKIELSKVPEPKFVYPVRAPFEPERYAIIPVYNNGVIYEPIALTNEAVTYSGFNSDKVDSKCTVKVTYMSKSLEFEVSITDRELSGIAVAKVPNKVDYIQGEATTVDTTGGMIELIYNNGEKEQIKMNAAMCSGYDLSKVGKQTVMVTSDGFTADYEINVTAKDNPVPQPTPNNGGKGKGNNPNTGASGAEGAAAVLMSLIGLGTLAIVSKKRKA